MTIELHTWNTPNGRKISVALEEMGLPYKVIPVNISKGEQMAPDFLAISPNNKIPAIVDPDGPGGKRVSIFESGAILLYLGEKTGKFLPMPLIERIPVYEWLMWQMGGFGPMPGQVHHFIALENETERAYGLKRYAAETRRLYGVLDRRLAGHEFVAGPLVGRRLCHSRLGLAAPAPQGGAEGFSQCRALVQRADGAAGDQARHGSQAGLRLSPAPRCLLSLAPPCGERVGGGGSPTRSADDRWAHCLAPHPDRKRDPTSPASERGEVKQLTPASSPAPSSPRGRRARCPSASAAPTARSAGCRETARSSRRRARSAR